MTKQLIRNQLVQGLEEECACVLDPSTTITDIQTQCNVEESHLIYIGRIIGTRELRPLVLFGLLEDWKNKDTSVIRAFGESLMMDKSCPLYLSSPRDPNCVPKMDPSLTPPTTDPKPSTSSTSIPSSSPTSTSEALQEESDDSTNIPILVACLVGGIFLGCFFTLCILMTVFCCRIRKRRKESIE